MINCFDIVSATVEEATNQLGEYWKINEEKYDILREYCDRIDTLAERIESKSLSAEVDSISKTVSVSIEAMDVIVETKENTLHDLFERSKLVYFASSGDNLVIKMVFPSVWDRVSDN